MSLAYFRPVKLQMMSLHNAAYIMKGGRGLLPIRLFLLPEVGPLGLDAGLL